MKNETSFSKLLPVLFGFFILGFVDVVGIATNHVKQDFALSDTLANLVAMMVFLFEEKPAEGKTSSFFGGSVC